MDHMHHHATTDMSAHHHMPNMSGDHGDHVHAVHLATATESPPAAGMSHDHMHHGGGMSMDHMMSMAFHFGCNETILFSWWKTSSVGGLIGSMIVIFIMATLYEGLKYYREFLFWKTYNMLEYRPVAVGTKPEENQNAHTVHYVGEVVHKTPPSMLSWMHIYQTFLHIVQVTLSFLLMLIFMTYNVWLCLAVVLGAAVGYFLFCWKKSVIVDVTEHCH